MADHSVGTCEDAESIALPSITFIAEPRRSDTRRGRNFPPKGKLHPFGVIEENYFVYVAVNDYCTRWKSARFRVETNLESLSQPLQQGVRFFHPPIPAPPWASLTSCLLFDDTEKRRVGLTTFPEIPARPKCAVHDCLGSDYPPVVLMTTCPQF